MNVGQPAAKTRNALPRSPLRADPEQGAFQRETAEGYPFISGTPPFETPKVSLLTPMA